MFERLSAAVASPFDELQREYEQDPRDSKVIINTGTIVDAQGQTLRLKCIEEAERYLAKEFYSKSYPPTAGIPQFLKAAKGFLRLSDVAAVATPSCGAVYLLFYLLRKCGVTRVVTTAPTWGMYGVFADVAGLKLEAIYAHAVDLAAYLGEGDALLLQACCQNPSGIDLSEEEFAAIAYVLEASGRPCVLDVAYQGIKCDILHDLSFAPLFKLRNAFCAQFFDKNFGIYAEGASVVYAMDCRLYPHLEALVSGLFGLAPVHGQWLVATVVERYFASYYREMELVRRYVAYKREWLAGRLDDVGFKADIRCYNGIYAYLALSAYQINDLKKAGLYLVDGGRLNLGSVTEKNIDTICRALQSILQ